MSPSARPWLADGLATTLASLPGSPERMHVASLLAVAQKIRLDDEVTRSIADTVSLACSSVERNADCVRLRSPTTWVEYSHAARVTAFGGGAIGHVPQTVGALVACDPSDPTNVAVFVAWRNAPKPGEGVLGSLHHSYALMRWNLSQLLAVAAAAPGGEVDGAPERLLEAASAEVPLGFEIELDVLRGPSAANDPARDEALMQTRKDVTGEHVFLLAALLMLETSAVTISPSWDADKIEVSAASAARKWPWTAAGFSQSWFGAGLYWRSPVNRKLPVRCKKSPENVASETTEPISA